MSTALLKSHRKINFMFLAPSYPAAGSASGELKLTEFRLISQGISQMNAEVIEFILTVLLFAKRIQINSFDT